MPKGNRRTNEDREAAKEFVFNLLCEYAKEGRRCPGEPAIRDLLKKYDHALNYPGGETFTHTLCLEGKLRLTIGGQNWRTAYILVGEDAGKSTMRDPKNGTVYLTVAREVVRHVL